jgi:hypothetical protein
VKGRVASLLGVLLLVALLVFGLYLWGVLSWPYSEGERAGILQEFSSKGWLCKTYEGELEAYASDRTILVGLVLQARGTARYALVSDDLSYEPYGFMVRRDDSAFRLVANRALARLYRSGAIGAIYSKWFGALGKPTPALVLMYALQGLPE